MNGKVFRSALLGAGIHFLCLALANAEPEVRNVTAVHCWPWTNVVSICYEVDGTIPTNAPPLFVTVTDRVENVTYVSSPEALSGETGRETGMHQVIWNLDKQGLSLQSTDVTFTVAYEWPLYCVVDLSGGAYTSSYPVTYMANPPNGGFNTDTYKTKKLVLRRIDPGTFMMLNYYETTLTKPYYIGVFEVTQKQWQLVSGTDPSYWNGDKRPVEQVGWYGIRGNTNDWPTSSSVSANSFMGRLQTRTGLPFDLPTEAQWEYACRAGTTNEFNGNGLNTLGRYLDNRTDGKGGYTNAHTTVGAYLPNAWGLYDMHGNVEELCLDWYGSLSPGAIDPVGPVAHATGQFRVYRGGGWWGQPGWCTSSHRSSSESSYVGSSGFRVVCHVEW